MKHPLYRLFENRALQHIFFWLIYLGPTCYYLLTVCDAHNGVLPLVVIVLLALITAYINLYYLVPRFLLAERYLHYFAALLGLLVVYCAVYTAWYVYFLEHYFKITDHEDYVKAYIGNFFELAIMLAVTTAFKLSKDWFRQSELNRELSNQKLLAEVQFLRAQINPHFLFNTLNNLYALTLKKSDSAPEAVIKLSGMMEYMLYESNESEIALEKEMEYLQNYIAIEKLRYRGKIKVDFTGCENSTGHTIAPLLLLPFVENAFKHAENEEEAIINISLGIQAGKLYFMVENTKDPVGPQKTEGRGVGIQNVTKRLELLYNGRYELIVMDEGHKYKVNLVITF